MMFHIGFKMNSAVAYYGTGMGTPMRAHVIAAYSQAVANVMKLANEWLSIMAKNEWLEKPPHALDRKSPAEKPH